MLFLNKVKKGQTKSKWQHTKRGQHGSNWAIMGKQRPLGANRGQEGPKMANLPWIQSTMGPITIGVKDPWVQIPMGSKSHGAKFLWGKSQRAKVPHGLYHGTKSHKSNCPKVPMPKVSKYHGDKLPWGKIIMGPNSHEAKVPWDQS